jgi:hypothetical protein
MDEGMIFIANLSRIGPEIRDILGCFMLSLLHLTAVSRSDTPIHQRRPFHIYCDEAHHFITQALEELLIETRKFKVSLILAHHFLTQFTQRKTDAISSVGTTIIFNVDTRDAQYLRKDLRRLASVDDLITLNKGEAIARIGTDIVRIETLKPLQIPEKDFRDRIIKETRRKYCRPAHEVKKMIRQRGDRWHKPFTPLTPIPGSESNDHTMEELTYDEF